MAAIKIKNPNYVEGENNKWIAVPMFAESGSTEEYATKEELNTKANIGDSYTKDESDSKYLTNHQDVSGKLDAVIAETIYATKEELNTHATEAKEYTDQVINDLVGQAPAALDTIYELAEAIEDNSDVVDTLNSAITNKLDKTEAEETYAPKASVGLRVSDFLEDPVDIRTLSGQQIYDAIKSNLCISYFNAVKPQNNGYILPSLYYHGFASMLVNDGYSVYPVRIKYSSGTIYIEWCTIEPNKTITNWYINFYLNDSASLVKSTIDTYITSGVIYIGKMKQLPL